MAQTMVDFYSASGIFHDTSKRQASLSWVDAHSYNNPASTFVKELRCVKTDQNYINSAKLMYQNEIIPIWSSLSHEHILSFLAIHCDEGFVPTIEVPYCAKGNILDYNMHFDNPDKKLQAIQIASGLRYLHGKNVSHGNICSANILIGDDSRVRISDPCLNFRMRQLTDNTYKSIPASYQYKSPEELLEPSKISHQGDVYSWASVIYEVFSGKKPYHGLHYGCGVLKIIHYGHRTLDRPSEITPQLWSILVHCWTLKPEDRPLMREAELMLYDL